MKTQVPGLTVSRLPVSVFCTAILSLSFVLCAGTACAQNRQPDTEPGHLAVLGGFGESFPGWGQTTERVKTVDITFRYAGLINRPLGPAWLGAQEQLWIEIPIMYAYEPDNAPIFAMNFLFCFLFPRPSAVEPYITIGGGPVYVGADIPGVGSRLCGNYQAGAGIRIPLRKEWGLHIEGRYHHISNLGLADPNVPINSLRCLMGLSREF